MHGLPKNMDLSFIENKNVEQVCIGEHQIILHFDEYLSISIETSIYVSNDGNKPIEFAKLPEAAPVLCTLLGRCVRKAIGSPDGTLDLEFENGTRVVIHDDNERYESYQIKYGDKEIVV